MKPRARGALQGLAVILGCGVALFTVGVAVFEGPSDPGSRDRLITYVVVGTAYLLGGLVLARATATGPWRWLAWYAGPAYVLLLLVTVKDKLGQPDWLLLHAIYAALVTAMTLLGAWLGLVWARWAETSG
jgi:hypothetical protein